MSKDTQNNRLVMEIDSLSMTGATNDAGIEIRTNGGPGANKFGFGFWGPDEAHRETHGGPMVQGPCLYGYGRSVCIHSGPITANEPVLYLQDGDIVRVKQLVRRGLVYYYDFKATVSRGYPKFTLGNTSCLSDQGVGPLDIEAVMTARRGRYPELAAKVAK